MQTRLQACMHGDKQLDSTCIEIQGCETAICKPRVCTTPLADRGFPMHRINVETVMSRTQTEGGTPNWARLGPDMRGGSYPAGGLKRRPGRLGTRGCCALVRLGTHA